MTSAIFLIKSSTQHWRPPFGKEITELEMDVDEGKKFDDFPKEGPIFKLVKCDRNKALIEFSGKFTLKGHENPRNRQIWIEKEEPVSFTYLWGNDGLTKSLKLKEIVGEVQAVEEMEKQEESSSLEVLMEEKPS